MTARPVNPVLLGTATNAAIRAAVADQLRRAPSADACPPHLRNLVDELRRQEEASPQQVRDPPPR